jgi:hypothetical protein
MLKKLSSSGSGFSLPQIHKVLARRIFIHIGNDDDKEDPTFLLLCRGCCSSGQTGLVLGRDAQVWAAQLHSRPEALWRLSAVDSVAMAIPSAKARAKAVQALRNPAQVHTLSHLPTSAITKQSIEPEGAPSRSRLLPWWAPPMTARLSEEANLDRSEMSNISNATFSKFLKPQTLPANLMIGSQLGSKQVGRGVLRGGGFKLEQLEEEEEEADGGGGGGDVDGEDMGGGKQGGASAWALGWEEAVMSTSSNLDFLKQSVTRQLDMKPDASAGINKLPGLAGKTVTDTTPNHVIEVPSRPVLQTWSDSWSQSIRFELPLREVAASVTRSVARDTPSPRLARDVASSTNPPATLAGVSSAVQGGGGLGEGQGGGSGIVKDSNTDLSEVGAAVAREFLRSVKKMRLAHLAAPAPVPSPAGSLVVRPHLSLSARGAAKALPPLGGGDTQTHAEADLAPPRFAGGKGVGHGGDLATNASATASNWLSGLAGALGDLQLNPGADSKSLAVTVQSPASPLSPNSPRRVVFAAGVKEKDLYGNIQVWGLTEQDSHPPPSRSQALADLRNS